MPQLKTYEQLTSFKAENPALFSHLLDLCHNSLVLMQKQYGFCFFNLAVRTPKKEEMLACFHDFYNHREKALNWAISQLNDYFQNALEKERITRMNILTLNIKELDEEQLAKYNYLKQKGYFEKLKNSLVVNDDLMKFVYEGKIPRKLQPKKRKEQRTEFRETRRNAYKKYVNLGEQEAKNLLVQEGIKKKLAEKLLMQFQEQLLSFTGKARKISSSLLEDKIAGFLEQENIFFRRHVHYKKIGKTEREYTADFLVGNSVIEVVSPKSFIHNAEYFKRLNEKKEIARENGFEFIMIYSFENYKRILRAIKVEIPEEAYKIKEAKELESIMPENPAFKERQRQARKRLLYRKNVYAIGRAN